MEENKTVKYVIYVVGFLAVLAVCWWLLGNPDVHDQRERAGDVREELGRAGATQQNAQEHLVNVGRGIDSSIERTDRISDGIGEAEDRIADVQSRSAECSEILRDSESRIAESRRVFQAVRERARKN